MEYSKQLIYFRRVFLFSYRNSSKYSVKFKSTFCPRDFFCFIYSAQNNKKKINFRIFYFILFSLATTKWWKKEHRKDLSEKVSIGAHFASSGHIHRFD